MYPKLTEREIQVHLDKTNGNYQQLMELLTAEVEKKNMESTSSTLQKPAQHTPELLPSKSTQKPMQGPQKQTLLPMLKHASSSPDIQKIGLNQEHVGRG